MKNFELIAHEQWSFAAVTMVMPSKLPGIKRRVVASALIVIALWWVFVCSEPFSSDSFAPSFKGFSNTSSPSSLSINTWKSPLESLDIFDDPPTNSEAIRRLCSETEWNPNLLLTCDNSGGGVGNLRNSILNCVRYAISAGATMTLPKIIPRNPDNIADIWNRERTSFEHIFDKTHYVDSLKLSCPQLRLVKSTSDFLRETTTNNNNDNDNVTLSLLPERIVKINPDGMEHPEKWRGVFYQWLSNNTNNTGPARPMVVDLERSYLQYPIYSDPEDFALDFGTILKFRVEARTLATATLKNLLLRYSPWTVTSAPIWHGAFFGAHLRTERDSRQGWPWWEYEYSKYDTQSKYYLEQAAASGTPVIYLASGDLAEVEHFTQDAQSHNLTVVTKHELLDGEDEQALDKLTFDQQALIDYLVLLKASDFAGVGHSSFAWNIALWRHKFAKQRDHLHGPQLMSDELSQVYGTVNQYPEYAPCIWP